MTEPYYYHYFSKKHTRSKKDKKKKPALVIDITESIEGALPVYLIKILSQKYRDDDFNKRDNYHRFVASNGFVLTTSYRPDVGELNCSSGRRGTENRLFVRGSNCSYDNNVVKAYCISYIEELKIAVEEYNSYCLED